MTTEGTGEAEAEEIDPRLARLIGLFLDARPLPGGDAREFSVFIAGLVADCPADLRRELAVFLHSEGIPEEWLDPVLPAGTELTIETTYAIRAHIGGGGMGHVYVARDTRLGRDVALKLMRRLTPDGWADTPGGRDRFLGEATITAALAHPSIPAVYGVHRGDSGAPTYYAMRLVDEAHTVSDAIEKVHKGRRRDRSFESMDARQLIRHLQGVCEAVHQAHEKGYVHRDLKPANLALDGDGEHPCVLDWGLAKAKGWAPERDGESDVAGTLPYMSPEQASGRGPCDPANDIYSLGALLYHVLTNQAPFTDREGSSPPSWLTVEGKILQGKLTPPEQINRRAPRRLARVCRKAMAKDPGRRYASAADLARELRLWLDDEPPLGVAEPWPERARRVATKRYPDRVLAIGVALIATVGLLYAASLVGAARARVRTEKAEYEAREIAAQARRDIQVAAITRAEAERTRAAYDFIDEDFLESRMAYGVNRDITLAQVLDRAVPRIEARFAKDPEGEAKVKFIVAKKYRGLGLFDRAEPLARRSAEIRQSLHGADDPRTLASRIMLAGIIGDSGRLDEAERLMRENLRRSKEVNGEKHPDTTTAMVDLGSLLLERVRRGSFKPDTLPFPGKPGNPEDTRDIRREGEALLKRASEIQAAVEGPESLPTLASINNFATSLIEQQRYAEIESLLDPAVLSCRKGFGDDHPMTIAIVNNLMTAKIQGEKLVDEGELDRSLERARRVMGNTHPYTRAAIQNIVSANTKPGDPKALAKAEPGARDLWRMRKEEKGADDGESLMLMDQYARILLLEGNYAAAEPLLGELVDRRRRLGYPAQWLGLSLQTHATTLLECGRPADAERELKEARSLFETMNPRVDVFTAGCDNGLGECARVMGRLVEAEQLALASLPAIQASPLVSKPVKLRTLDRVIRLYEDLGKKDQADLWRKKKMSLEN